MKRSIWGLTVVLGLLVIPARVESSVDFDKAVKLYSQGKYDSTIAVGRIYLRKYGRNPESEKMVPLIIEALVRKEKYASAYRLFSMFRQKFPQSPFFHASIMLPELLWQREKNTSRRLPHFPVHWNPESQEPSIPLFFLIPRRSVSSLQPMILKYSPQCL